MTEGPLLDPPERVLSTLNPDGSRLWIRPKAAMGRWWKRRRVVAWGLMILFTAIPWLTIGGRPVMLMDLASRDFVFFGTAFRPTDSLLLVLLMLSIFLGIFLLTALTGRAWCGWACPQTVYLEFLFRPIERLIEGQRAGRTRTDVPFWRKALKWAVFSVLALHMANTFLAYFAGPQTVLDWSFGAPGDHPGAFAVVLITTLLILYDFGFFREQMCTLVCPYARLQSVLLDRESLLVGYDVKRGEPRGHQKKGDETVKGDCIDCNLCVAACPTGIDIRQGLQLECVACTQCIDACDAVMDKVEKPRGLIRYASQNTLESTPHMKKRLRVLIYPVLLIGLLTALVTMANDRPTSLVRVLRFQDVPYHVLADGRVQNLIKLRFENMSGESRTYSFEPSAGTVVMSGHFPLTLQDRESREIILPLASTMSIFTDGRAELTFSVSDGVDFEDEYHKSLSGPVEEAE